MKKEVHKIKPREGLKLRFPGIKRFLNPDGEFVEWNSYWHRRLLDGDITVVSTMEEEKNFWTNLESESAQEIEDQDQN